jgi:hypothetical protein
VGGALNGILILNLGLIVCAIGIAFGWMQYAQTKQLPSHQAMLDVSATIWETCKTYVLQQGKFLAGLWVLIAICIVYYFGVLSHMAIERRSRRSLLLDHGYSGFLYSRLVRHPHQYRGQFPRRLCITERRAFKHRQHLSYVPV